MSTESTVLVRYGYSLVTVEVKVEKYNKTLNVRSLGKPVSFVFSLSPDVMHQDSRENKTNCFPRDLTLRAQYLDLVYSSFLLGPVYMEVGDPR